MKRTAGIFLILLILLVPCSGMADEQTTGCIAEHPVQFSEPPLFGQVQVTELPNGTLLLSYLSQNSNWRSEAPYYQVYGERFAILNRDGSGVWEHAFRYLDEPTAEIGDYYCQYRLAEDTFLIELYFDSEMDDYGWYLCRTDGSAIEKSNKRVPVAEEDICYTVNLYPFLLEEYRHMDEFGNPRVVIQHIPDASVGLGIATNYKAVWGDRLYMAETLKDGQYALNVYGPDCELITQFPLPFREIPFSSTAGKESEIPYRNLCSMLVNGEKAVFLAAEQESDRPYSLYILNLNTKEFSTPVPLPFQQGEIELLAIQDENILLSLQSIPMLFSVKKGDASHWWHLYQVMPEGQTAFLEDLDQQLIWHDAQEDGSVLLLLRDTEKDTYSFRTYQY